MKRILIVVLAAIFTTLLFGCSSAEKEVDTKPTAANPTPYGGMAGKLNRPPRGTKGD